MGKIIEIFDTMAWIGKLFSGDSDDLTQTMLLTQHIIENKTIDHASLVRMFRTSDCGIDPKIYKSQISKLYFSEDPFYIAEDGLTDGGAMRAFPLVYFANKPEFPYYVRAATRITHNTPDAILSALLVSLRYKYALENVDICKFVSEFKIQAIKLYPIEKCKFFFDVVDLAYSLITSDPIETLLSIHKEVGLTHIAWGCPIAACFWSYCLENYPDFVPTNYDPDKRCMEIQGVKFTSLLLDDDRRLFYYKRLDEMNATGQPRYFGNDIDTFFHLSFSMACGQFGIKHQKENLQINYYSIAKQFEDSHYERCSN